MSDRVLILHGWGGSDAPHWQAELAGQIAMEYGTVSFPLLDNPHFPSKNRWLRQVRAILSSFKPTTVVCHSLGCTLWMWLALEEIDTIERLYLVSPPSLTSELDTIKSFFPIDIPTDFKAKQSHIVVSDNDPYITLDEARDIAEQTASSIEIVHNAGHINADSGHGKWKLIEEMVLR